MKTANYSIEDIIAGQHTDHQTFDPILDALAWGFGDISSVNGVIVFYPKSEDELDSVPGDAVEPTPGVWVLTVQ